MFVGNLQTSHWKSTTNYLLPISSSQIISVKKIMNSSPTTAPSKCKCATCSKAGALKKCAECSTTPYCSHECQKKDWKSHKKICSSNATASSSGGPSSENASSSSSRGQQSAGQGLSAPFPKPFHALDSATYLHNRPEQDVFKLLIDCYRLRAQDDVIFSDSHGPVQSAGFNRFLRLAEGRRSILPDWWSAEKAAECETFGATAGPWSSLATGTNKAGIIAHYRDDLASMQLRMLGEQVYGGGSGGHSGKAMCQVQMRAEKGEIETEDLDASAAFLNFKNSFRS